jgi:hypothetical protein
MAEIEHKADLSLEGFQLWEYGRQFPDAEDFWDGNWLSVSVKCETDSSRVETGGPIIHLSELLKFLNECKLVYRDLSGKATLNCMEPELRLVIEMQSRGRFDFIVWITPDHLSESHSFTFNSDQSYLLPFLNDLEKLLRKYPLYTQNDSKALR